MTNSAAGSKSENSPLAVYKTVILEKHLDSFGHVNNAQYAVLFEEARWDLITRNGFGWKQVQEQKIGPVILEMTIKFKKELKLRDEIEIHTHCDNPRLKITQIHQKIFLPGGEEASEGKFTVGLFDLKARRLIEPTPEWLRAVLGNPNL